MKAYDTGLICGRFQSDNMNIKTADDSDLFKRLDEINGQLQDIFISAHKCDLLHTEREAIKTELWLRGYEIH